MPSKKYFEKVGEYLANISKNIFGKESISLLDYDKSKILLKDKSLNQNMIESAESLHDSIDSTDFGDINTINISACGSPTIGRIEISPQISIGPFTKKEDFRVKFTNGDTTVPLPSADGVDADGRYFVNGVSHGTMPSAGSVPNFVYSIIKDEEVALGGDFGDSDYVCDKIEGDVLSKHSPIDLHIYDESDNHAGPNENGDIENNIEGVVYETVGDTSFIFLPKGKNFKIQGSATADGEFDLAIETISGDDVLSTKYWQDVQINIDSEIKLDIESGVQSSDISLDLAGDGEFETKLSTYDTLSKNENYLDFSYEKFIKISSTKEENVSGGQTFGYLLKKKDMNNQTVEYIASRTQQFIDKMSNIELLAKNLQIEDDPSTSLPTGKAGSGQEEEKFGIADDTKTTDGNNLVASAESSKFKIKLGAIIFSLSTMLLIGLAIKKYYFKVK